MTGMADPGRHGTGSEAPGGDTLDGDRGVQERGSPLGAAPDPDAGAVQQCADAKYPVDARGATGVQVGDSNTQIIYTYTGLTWTDGVAPPPLAAVSGTVDSPYRGLSAFEERDAAFFFGRESAVT